MKTIRYELKLLNTFVIRAFITQLDKTLGPVISTIFSYDYKKTLRKFALRIRKIWWLVS